MYSKYFPTPQLEDDMIASPNWLSYVHELALSARGKQPDWIMISFSVLGFIGKCFQIQTLDDLIYVFTKHYEEFPVDLLLAKVCG